MLKRVDIQSTVRLTYNYNLEDRESKPQVEIQENVTNPVAVGMKVEVKDIATVSAVEVGEKFCYITNIKNSGLVATNLHGHFRLCENVKLLGIWIGEMYQEGSRENLLDISLGMLQPEAGIRIQLDVQAEKCPGMGECFNCQRCFYASYLDLGECVLQGKAVQVLFKNDKKELPDIEKLVFKIPRDIWTVCGWRVEMKEYTYHMGKQEVFVDGMYRIFLSYVNCYGRIRLWYVDQRCISRIRFNGDLRIAESRKFQIEEVKSSNCIIEKGKGSVEIEIVAQFL